MAGSLPDGTALPYATTRLPNGPHTVTVAVTRATGVTTSTRKLHRLQLRLEQVPAGAVRRRQDRRRPTRWTGPRTTNSSRTRTTSGTGFTWLDRPSKGTGYIKNNLDINSGKLNVTTTRGLAVRDTTTRTTRSRSASTRRASTNLITAKIANPPAGTGNYEQAGLWFGNDEKNYVKLVVISTPTGAKVQLLPWRSPTWRWAPPTRAR